MQYALLLMLNVQCSAGGNQVWGRCPNVHIETFCGQDWRTFCGRDYFQTSLSNTQSSIFYLPTIKMNFLPAENEWEGDTPSRGYLARCPNHASRLTVSFLTDPKMRPNKAAQFFELSTSVHTNSPPLGKNDYANRPKNATNKNTTEEVDIHPALRFADRTSTTPRRSIISRKKHSTSPALPEFWRLWRNDFPRRRSPSASCFSKTLTAPSWWLCSPGQQPRRR